MPDRECCAWAWQPLCLILQYVVVQQANGVIKLAADPSLSKVTGKYYMYDEPSSMPREANDPKIQQRLWDVLEKQTGARWPANIA